MSRPTDWHEVFGIKDPTPGDTHTIRQVAHKWGGIADAAEYAETKLKGWLRDDAVSTWIGKAGEAFAAHSSDLPGQLDKAKNSYRQASEAMTWWAGRLESHQYDADRALVQGRAAKQDLASAHQALSAAHGQVSTASGAGALTYTGPAAHAPKPEDVTKATNALHSAQAAEGHAQGLVNDAQGRLDAARRLAQQAGSLRETDGRTTSDKVHHAADAGIKPRSWWEKFKDGVAEAWHVIVAIAKIVVMVLGVVALIIGGPLAWIVFAAALIVLADTLMKYFKGEATLLDVALAALSCIPCTKGLTTLAELSAAFKAGGMLGAGAHLLAAGKTAIVEMAAGVRALGSTVSTALREFAVSGVLALTLKFSRMSTEALDSGRALTAIHDANMYLPGGLDVGALHLPTDGPVGDLLQGYDRFGGSSPEDFAAAWGNGHGGYDWSKVPNDGFDGPRVPMEMHPGEVLDRFGDSGGRYLSPPGTPYAERGLPPSNIDGHSPNFGYHQYQVAKPFTADVGYIAPAMGQPGGGVQVFVNADHIPDGLGHRVNVEWLMDHGYLEELVP